MEPNTSRRALVKGAAWAVPTVAVASFAPAFASSYPTPKVGMFVTVEANGYGYDTTTSRGAGVVEQLGTSGQATTGSPSDYKWSDATGYPTVSIGGINAATTQTNSTDIVNKQGTYTPTGTGAQGSFSGTGMWISSPIGVDGNPVSGTTTLKAGATFKNCITLVTTSQTANGLTGWGSTNTLTKNFSSNNSTVANRVDYSGSALNLSWSSWNVTAGSGANSGLWVGTGCVTFTTTSDISATSNGSSVVYNQLMMTPALTTYQYIGLGNGAMLYCSNLSFVSGSLVTTAGSYTNTETPQLGSTISYVRAKESNSLNYKGRTPYQGTC